MRSSALIVLLLVLFLLPTTALAQGPVVDPWSSPVPLPPTPAPHWFGPVRIDLYRVTAQVKDQVATTHVEQVFVNEGQTPVEGTYLFPLPEQAAISEFNMIVDGQKIEGQLMRKEEARAIYESIVRQQRDPALLEYVGRDLFQASIFPIPPGGQRKIELTYSQVLPMTDGLVHYRYPLRTNPFIGDRFGARFDRPIGQLAISVSIETTEQLKAIYSPSHPVVVARDGDYQAQVGYEESNVTPEADFDLYFSTAASAIGVSLLTYKPAGDDGYFLLLATPKVAVAEDQVVARDVLLVLDTSGSMTGQKMEQARNALLYVLGKLNPQDRFNIISFSTGVRQFERAPVAMDQIEDGKRFVSDLQAGGGTDINRALLEALAQVDATRPAVIIFLTDGLPTEGEVAPERIIANVGQNSAPNVQVFAFGVGDDVNTVLLDSISQENRGASAYVRPNQAIDEIVSGFYAKVATPVLADLKLDFGGVFVEEIYPYPLPDLFAGTQLVLVGRYRNGGPTALQLSGLVNGQEKAVTFDDLTFRAEGGEPFIARLWATRKIGYLLNQIRLRGQNPEMVDEIVRLATKFGIATPYTSFFVPEPAPPIGMPRVDDTLGGAPALLPTASPAPATVQDVETQVARSARQAVGGMAEAPAAGAWAVAESQARETLRAADQAAAGGAARGLRYAADKAFAYQAGLWVDTAFKTDMPKVELAFGSDAYFALLAEHPAWAPYFAVSPNVIVALDGVAYVVIDAGDTILEPTATPAAGQESPIAQQPSPAVTPPGAVTAEPVAIAPPVETQPEAPQPAPQAAPLCTAPAFGIGLLLAPGVWAWRRRRR
jgi:Ca-activated chloride channel family protein